MRHIALALAGLTVAGWALAAGQPFRAVSAGHALIAGRVTDAGSGRPLGGAIVTIIEFERGERAEAPTDDAGRYGFDDIASGTYRVHVRHDRHVERIFGSSFPVGTDEQRLALAAGERREDIDFALAAAGVVRGRVTADGEPVDGAVVLVGRLDTRRTPSSVAGIAPPATTGPDGRYEVGGLPAGTWHVEAYAAGTPSPDQPPGAAAFARTFYPGVTQPELAMPVQVAAGGTLSDVEFGLERTRFHTITAVLPPALAAPAAGLEVVVGSLPPGTKFAYDHRAIVGDGTLRVFRLRPGRYVVWARVTASGVRQADWRVMDVHGDPPPIRFEFRPTGRMAGRVVGPDRQSGVFDGVRVVAALAFDGTGPDPLSPDDAEATADGRFAIDGLFGDRALRVIGLPSGWAVLATRRAGVAVTAPITVGAGETVGDLEIEVGPGQ